MLRSLKDLERYAVVAADGEVGKVRDFYLDDERWGIRYLVVDPRASLGFGSVLVSPISFRRVDWESKSFHLALTVDKVRKSPGVNLHAPVSRQHERDHAGYYEYRPYWGYAGLWAMGAYPGLLASTEDRDVLPRKESAVVNDAHLRSASEVRGYHVQASDKDAGHIEDFIVDDRTWQVRYLVINTSRWWFGKKVLIPPQWARSVSWEERLVHVDMDRDVVENSPEWVPSSGVNRRYELDLYDYYGRPVDWDRSGPPPPAPTDLTRG